MAANNNTGRSVDHAAPLMRHLSNYAQETLRVMFHIRLMALEGRQKAENR